jgi:hypothetical protein
VKKQAVPYDSDIIQIDSVIAKTIEEITDTAYSGI